MVSDEEETSREPYDPAAVRAQLERILASPEFHAPERGRRFLRYIVEETLEGRSEQLKAYTIAQAVFARGASFDAQNDPVVRIEAGRIRRALERYYLVSGSSDPIGITIPKGGYSPQFSSINGSANPGEGRDLQNRGNKRVGLERSVAYRDLLLPIGVPALFGVIAVLALIRPLEAYFSRPRAPPAPAASTVASKVSIVVEPFAALGGSSEGVNFAKGLADQLLTKLMKAENLVVLAPDRSDTQPIVPLFSLQGSVVIEGAVLHLHVRMINGADGTVIWANQYDRQLRGRTFLDVEDEIAMQIALEISNRKQSAAPTNR
ncbi:MULTISPECIES: hypothetical protein [unclassified Rhizobium]|uniref:hypothetical protein n=1 Tax=unclassified Rhizobium TaxID=2613769 RepID=UPI001C836B85|nr:MULTISPECIES: hypothetical protein [unclassified Rhizobium]MBX5214459.1 hypothetical protein [Rhizobium sp. NLR9a]MBX5245699.1 hypothetical protein [Rhizobium sp. NLR3b]MBX5273616.1 hypothetical protein [Rhizobium sp. NLR13a]MBX5279834.1 hypothetical protein [Rhizobium sp. NLR10a]MBX5291748.1 hypothetical protein [Rhizobium sp. NLR15a]